MVEKVTDRGNDIDVVIDLTEPRVLPDPENKDRSLWSQIFTWATYILAVVVLVAIVFFAADSDFNGDAKSETGTSQVP